MRWRNWPTPAAGAGFAPRARTFGRRVAVGGDVGHVCADVWVWARAASTHTAHRKKENESEPASVSRRFLFGDQLPFSKHHMKRIHGIAAGVALATALWLAALRADLGDRERVVVALVR